MSRPGTEYVDTPPSQVSSETPPRLIPFIVSTVAAYAMLFGNNFIQFYYEGAAVANGSGGVYQLASPYAAADLPLLKFVQSADVMTLTHPNYPPYNLSRISANQFQITPVTFGATINAPTNVTCVPTNTSGSPLYIYGYVVTAVSLDGTEESIPSNQGYTGSAILDGTNNKVINLTWTAPSEAVSYYNIYKTGPTPSTSGTLGTVFGYIGQSISTTFTDNNIAPDFSQTPPTFQNPFASGAVTSISVLTQGSGGSGYQEYFTFTGNGSGASGYALINRSNNQASGAVLLAGGSGYTNVNVTAATGTFSATLSPISGNNPAVCTYFQQRLVYGATENAPESLFFSQTGNFNNFDTSLVVLDSDAITASLAGRQVNYIKALVPMSTGLVAFTSGGAFLISGGNQVAAITPSSISALPQASSGANDVPPIVVNYNILYIQARGNIVRDLSYNFYLQNYYGYDRSTLSSHLFINYQINEWAYAEEPHRIIWAIRNDGILLSLTYVPEQEVFGWAHHDTNGQFISICTIPEGNVNAVYLIVQRFINGNFIYYVERFANRLVNYIQDAWCLDCAYQAPLTYPDSTLLVSAATGNVTLTSLAPVFSSSVVGDIVWTGGGQIQITAFNSATAVEGIVLSPILETTPNDPNNLPLPQYSGSWSYGTPTNTATVLWLAGLTVSAIVDGVPQTNQVVPSNGVVTFSQSGTKIIVGLPYQCQLQTLKLDAGEPTIQGKRKSIVAMTVAVDKTLGLKIGPNFNTLTEMKGFTQVPYTTPNPFYSGELRTNIGSQWTVEGQMCIQVDYPVPSNILGIVPEFMLGDTGR
ncbi:unnamed protein product [Sphagnum jensenii]